MSRLCTAPTARGGDTRGHAGRIGEAVTVRAAGAGPACDGASPQAANHASAMTGLHRMRLEHSLNGPAPPRLGYAPRP